LENRISTVFLTIELTLGLWISSAEQLWEIHCGCVTEGSFMLKYGSIALAAAFAGALSFAGDASALDRRVKVINNTSQTMVKLQASNIGTNSWEEDILGNRVLTSGREVVVNLDDRSGYCVFDLKATFRSGATAIRRRVNICKVASWTIND
jgi:hypothetical protein